MIKGLQLLLLVEENMLLLSVGMLANAAVEIL